MVQLEPRLPQKGMLCAQMLLVHGYRVTLRVDGKTHAVHVAGEQAVMCADARKPARPQTRK